MQEQQLEFSSHGTTCRGVLYLPDGSTGKRPCIVMAHGFALTHASGLLPFKQAFCDAGYAVFAFDYRSFGDSDGEPRQVMVPNREVEDYLAATRFVRTLEAVDASRICLWGTSFAGGLVIKSAALDGHVQATISQCPLVDGLGGVLRVMSYAGIGQILRLSYHATVDVLASLAGLPPRYVKAAGHPGEAGLMTAPDCYDGFVPILAANAPNKVAARISMFLPFHRPISYASRVPCPALLLICDRDSIAPADEAVKAAAKMAQATVKHYDVGHFDVYTGKAFEASIKDQLEFLRKVLPVAGKSA